MMLGSGPKTKQSFFQSWQYQNRFRTYNQRVGNCPANSKSPPAGNPNSNNNRVGSPVCNAARLWGTPFLHGVLHRSFRIRHNMPLFDFNTVNEWNCFPVSSVEPLPVLLENAT